MKQPKKLFRDQKKLLSICGLNPAEWMNHFEDNNYLHVIHKRSGEIKIIDKNDMEVVESRVSNKLKSSDSSRTVTTKNSEHNRIINKKVPCADQSNQGARNISYKCIVARKWRNRNEITE